jgi:hypothetical protein
VRPRTFELVRHEDVSGVSGTGVVAEGCEFTDGSVALRWHGKNAATSVWPDLDALLAVHGHGGKTVVRWFDGGPDAGGTDPVSGRAQLGHLVPWRTARPVR